MKRACACVPRPDRAPAASKPLLATTRRPRHTKAASYFAVAQERVEADYISRLAAVLAGSVRGINRTDTHTLGTSFGSLADLMRCKDAEAFSACPGIGPTKVCVQGNGLAGRGVASGPWGVAGRGRQSRWAAAGESMNGMQPQLEFVSTRRLNVLHLIVLESSCAGAAADGRVP